MLGACNPKNNNISELQQEVWKNPEDTAAMLRLGNAYAQQSRYDEAEETYKNALALDPELDAAYHSLGAVYFNRQDYPQARDWFSRHLARSPKDSLRLYDLGNALMQMKEMGIYEYPYAAGIRPWTWYLTALSSGSRLFDANNEPVFDKPSDPGYKAFEQIITWFQMGLISPERLTSANPHPSFWAGQAAFHQAWQGSLGLANNPEQSKVAPNGDYLVLPERHSTWLLPAGLTVSAFTDYPEAAMQLIEFLVAEDMQRFLFSANGLFPANISVFEALGREGVIDGFAAMNEQSKYLVSLPYDQPWYIEFEKEAEQTMLRCARGEQSTADALAALGEFARNLKAEYE